MQSVDTLCLCSLVAWAADEPPYLRRSSSQHQLNQLKQ